MLESWALASANTNFKLAWKTTTLLTFVAGKCCSDLTLLQIDNWQIFLKHHAAIFIPASGSRKD